MGADRHAKDRQVGGSTWLEHNSAQLPRVVPHGTRGIHGSTIRKRCTSTWQGARLIQRYEQHSREDCRWKCRQYRSQNFSAQVTTGNGQVLHEPARNAQLEHIPIISVPCFSGFCGDLPSEPHMSTDRKCSTKK